MPKRIQPGTSSRLARAFQVYLAAAFKEKGVTQEKAAELGGFNQGNLSAQLSGARPATLEMVENMSRVCGHSGTKLLTALRDAALDLDRDEPGWDAFIERVPVGELLDRDGRAQQASDAEGRRVKPKRAGKPPR